MKHRQFFWRKNWFWYVILFALAAVWIIPLVYMVSMSFRDTEQAFDPNLFAGPLTWKNYELVIKQNPLPRYFFNSLVVTIVSVLIVTLGASMAAFGLTRPGVRGKSLIYNLLLSSLMVPITALVIPLAQINSRLEWQNTYWGLIFPYAALGIPFGLVVIKGFMDNFPKELEEAATMDGCGSLRFFLAIVLPVLRPGLVVVVIWQFLTSWNEFFLALIVMTDKTMKTLPLVPMQYQGFYFSQPGALFAILVLLTVPTIVFYVLVQRNFIRGLLSGAVKG
jgi:raffinose/stachyose/melibiose transport system permease protein